MSLDRRRNLRRGTVAGAVLGLLVGAAGVASAKIPTRSSTPAPPSREQSASPDSYNGGVIAPGPGMTGSQATALVFKGLSGSLVRLVSLVDAPSSAASSSGLPWVNVQLDSDQGDDIEAVWLGSLAQGGVADLMRTNEASTKAVISGGQIVDTDKRGQPVTVPLGTGLVTGGQRFESGPDAELVTRITAVATDFNLTVRNVTILHPLSSAVMVTFTVPDGASIGWTLDDLRTALDGNPKTIEGSYIELVSARGEPLVRSSVAYRVGAGGLWFAPGQDERFGARHGNGPAARSAAASDAPPEH